MRAEDTSNSSAEGLPGTWLAGLSERETDEGRTLVDALMADWTREATSNPAAIGALQRQELAEAGQGKSPVERLDLLRAEVAKRRINQLSVQSYALASHLIDGTIDPATARAQGESLLTDVDTLTSAVKTIDDADTQRRLHRDLNEVRMEALYAVEQKAMSLRLNRYHQDHKK
jgi:hypothetical protein